MVLHPLQSLATQCAGPRDVCGRHRGAQRRREQRRDPQRRPRRRRRSGSAPAARCSGCRPIATATLRCRPRASRRCTTGSIRSAPFPSPSSRPSKAPRPARASRWRWPATSSSSARDAVFAASYSNVALSPDGGLSWHLGAGAAAPVGERMADAGRAPRRVRACMRSDWSTRSPKAARRWRLRSRSPSKLNARAPNALASIKELLNEARGARWSRSCRRSATTSCATCTTPTRASASRPSSPSRRRATNDGRGRSRDNP